jgi:hypothetical protein
MHMKFLHTLSVLQNSLVCANQYPNFQNISQPLNVVMDGG